MQSADLADQLTRVFGAPAGPLIEVRAPGRVNLIGEHVDYNDGFVCPMAIDRYAAIVCTPRSDGRLRIHSKQANETSEFPIDREVPKTGPAWSLYPRGVAEGLRQRNLLARGMDAVVDSDVPWGSGLSSSASFEIATGLALLTVNNATMPPMELAMLGVWAEHHYPGVPCGIMDQTISVLGQQGHALLLDCRDHTSRQVPLDDPHLRVVIANSNVKHDLVQGEYSARRNQCEVAVAHIQKRFSKVKSLRDATLDMLEDSRIGMDPTAFKRGRHVITEIQRTVDFAAAMEQRAYDRAGELMYASHASLRDDYAVSCVELDTLVEIARAVPSVYGARMTGGGFGGCIVALVKDDAVAPLTKALETEYQRRCGQHATVFNTVASQGAHVVKM
jgi:galactokinase